MNARSETSVPLALLLLHNVLLVLIKMRLDKLPARIVQQDSIVLQEPALSLAKIVPKDITAQ